MNLGDQQQQGAVARPPAYQLSTVPVTATTDMPKVSNAAPDAAHAEINYFSTVKDTGRPRKATVADALEAIRSGRFKDKVEAVRATADKNKRKALKKQLPCWTFSGTFSYRDEKSMTAHSGFAVIDLDHMDPPVWQATRDQLVKDPFVYALFTSPSGDGLKVLYRIPPDKGAHRAHYAALLQHVSNADPDPANRDPSRCCFVSWDPDLYVNEDAEVFTGKATAPPHADGQDGADAIGQDDIDQLLNDLSPEERAVILNEAEGVVAVAPLLNDILQQVVRVDFRKLAMLDGEKGRLRPHHYAVHSVEEVLRIAVRHGGGLCYSDPHAYIYAGGYWHQLDEAQVKDFLGRAAERMGTDLNDARFHLFRDTLFRQLQSAAPAPLPGDPSRVLINLDNGTLEIAGGKVRLRNPEPTDFLRYRLPFPFDATATAPEFMRFLNRVLPDPASQAIVSEFLGWVFAHDVNEDKALFLWGPTAQNGKSTLMNIVKRMFGPENISHYSLQRLCDEQGYTLAMAKDKLLNWGSEASSKAIASDKFKQLCERAPTEARLPYGRPFHVTTAPRMIVNCNQLPYMDEADEGVMRRMLIAPFRVRIPDSERDINLADRIYTNEAPGVLNWILEGMHRLRSNRRFTVSDASRAALAEHRVRVDSVAQFLSDEGLRPSGNTYRTLQELYSGYVSACALSGNRPCSSGTFSARLQAAGFDIQRRNMGRVVFCERHSNASE
jgi:putative DNA primase/helicase